MSDEKLKVELKEIRNLAQDRWSWTERRIEALEKRHNQLHKNTTIELNEYTEQIAELRENIKFNNAVLKTHGQIIPNNQENITNLYKSVHGIEPDEFDKTEKIECSELEMAHLKDDIRSVWSNGNLYWMPKAEAYILKDLEDQIDKLAKYILEYFPGNIVSEGACLTAIAIMEELRNNQIEFVEDLDKINTLLGKHGIQHLIHLDGMIKKWDAK